VLFSSVSVGVWLNATARRADRDTLSRGADALQSSIEEQIRILQLGGMGTRSLTADDVAEFDLDDLVGQIDFTVLSSLLGVISYPIDEQGTGPGEFLLLGVIRTPDFDVPDLRLSLREIDDLATTGGLYFSKPFVTTDPNRLDYVMLLTVDTAQVGTQLVGVAFRADRMLATALEAAGEGQYAAELVDARVTDRPVLSLGTAASGLEEARTPFGANTPVELVVHPGSDFHFVETPWLFMLSLGTGLLLALLLVWMGRVAESHSRSLAERLRLAQELNEGKDRFLATVSHELRTPLTVVLGIASEMGRGWDMFQDEERADLMAMMAEQAVEAANIVEDLLVAARSDPTRLRLALEDTSLEPHVLYAIGSLPDEGRRRVANHTPDFQVHADTTRLRQILRNVLENAVRYGGDEITVDAVSYEHVLTVVISDNGDLADSDVERIFEPYEQTEAAAAETVPGVGIGLYVSRLLARLMGGELDCVREEGWTRFRLQLPTSAPGADAEPELVSALS